MQAIFNEIKKYSDLQDMSANSISNRGTYWHLDHSLKVINGSCSILFLSDPEKYKRGISFNRMFVFTTGYIPRGKAKAPKIVNNRNPVTQLEISNQLQDAMSLLNQLDKLPAQANFKHPYFGLLNLRQTKKFLELHTIHHLKIIRDIVKNQ